MLGQTLGLRWNERHMDHLVAEHGIELVAAHRSGV